MYVPKVSPPAQVPHRTSEEMLTLRFTQPFFNSLARRSSVIRLSMFKERKPEEEALRERGREYLVNLMDSYLSEEPDEIAQFISDHIEV